MQIHFTPVPFRLLAFQPCRLREPDKLCQRKFLKSLLKFSSGHVSGDTELGIWHAPSPVAVETRHRLDPCFRLTDSQPCDLIHSHVLQLTLARPCPKDAQPRWPPSRRSAQWEQQQHSYRFIGLRAVPLAKSRAADSSTWELILCAYNHSEALHIPSKLSLRPTWAYRVNVQWS